MLEISESIATTYRREKLDDKSITILLAYIKDYANQKGKPEIYMQFVAALTFRIFYNQFGKIQSISRIFKSLDMIKPFLITTTNHRSFVFKPLIQNFQYIKKNEF